MTTSPTLLCSFAHPDDESLGMGGVLARYAAEGVKIHLLCATRGERGWNGPAEEDPGLRALGEIRTVELQQAAAALGLHEVSFLDYIDGDLDQANPQEAIARIAAHVRRIRPQVVVTFPPDGAYGHPDHIAISQYTNAALVCAADSAFPAAGEPYRVPKFYYMIDSLELVDMVRQQLGGIDMLIDGVLRQHWGWPHWAITTHVEAGLHWQGGRDASLCHRSQLPGITSLFAASEDIQRQLWGANDFYRVYSLVNGGRQVENDLFCGL